MISFMWLIDDDPIVNMFANKCAAQKYSIEWGNVMLNKSK